MGIYTLPDFQTETRYAIGNRSSSSPSLDDTRLDRWINSTYQWVAMPNHYRHEELEHTEYIPLVLNSATYTMTETYYFKHGITFYDTTTNPPPDVSVRKKRIEPMDKRDWDEAVITVGEPNRRAEWGNTLYLDRAAATETVGKLIAVDGYRQPPALSGAAATLLRPEWDEIIVAGSAWRAWMWIGEVDLAEAAKEDFGRLVNEVADWRKLGAEDWGNRLRVADLGPMGRTRSPMPGR